MEVGVGGLLEIIFFKFFQVRVQDFRFYYFRVQGEYSFVQVFDVRQSEILIRWELLFELVFFQFLLCKFKGYGINYVYGRFLSERLVWYFSCQYRVFQIFREKASLR